MGIPGLRDVPLASALTTGIFERRVERIFTRTAQVMDGFVFDLGDIDRREITGAHQPRSLDGIPTIGVDAVASLLWDQGGGDDPVVIVGDIGHGDGVLVDIQPNRACARVMHG